MNHISCQEDHNVRVLNKVKKTFDCHSCSSYMCIKKKQKTPMWQSNSISPIKKPWQPDKNRQHGENNQHGVNNPRQHCKIGNNIAKQTIRRNQSQTILQKRHIWKNQQYAQKKCEEWKNNMKTTKHFTNCRKLRIAHQKPYQNPGGQVWTEVIKKFVSDIPMTPVVGLTLGINAKNFLIYTEFSTFWTVINCGNSSIILDFIRNSKTIYS